jgi:NDP-sugar pyrophosphorylase family protein
VVFCLGYLGEQVAAALGNGARWGMEFAYVYDGPTLLGTGGALRRALPELGEAFFVMYGDSYLQCDFGAIERSFRESGKEGLMTVFRNDDQFDRSNVEFLNGRILRYDKAAHDSAMEYIDYGLSVFRREAFLPWTADARFDLGAVYRMLLDRDELAGYEVAERFYEIGSAEGLEETRALLESVEKRAQ